MQKLFNLLDRKTAAKGDIGIEIETEGKGIRPVENKFWQTTHDGSLRGRYPDETAEFIINGIIPFAKVEEAIDNLILEQAAAEFAFSFRTSVHVHLNVQDLTHAQLCNLIYTYYLLEGSLMDFCGDTRKANRFCLRLNDAEGVIPELREIFKNEDHLLLVRADTIRYASLNLEAFKKFGSIEFRGMRGTMDKAVLLPWIKMIEALRVYAVSKATPMDIHNELREVGVDRFAANVFGDMLKVNAQSVAESYSLSLDLPYAYREQKEKVKVVVDKNVIPKRLVGLTNEIGNPNITVWEENQMSRAMRADIAAFREQGEAGLVQTIIDKFRRKMFEKWADPKPARIIVDDFEAAPMPAPRVFRAIAERDIVDDEPEEEEEE